MNDGGAAARPLVLVAYATGAGSTRGVAQRIAARLRAGGAEVALRDVADVADVADVTAYDAVVLGSPVYDQHWLPAASELIDRAGPELAQRPVWLFSVGSFGDRQRPLGRAALREPRDIGRLRAAVDARGYRVFAGLIDRERWPGWSRLLFRVLGGRFGDNRDWPEIEAWADEVAAALPAPARR